MKADSKPFLRQPSSTFPVTRNNQSAILAMVGRRGRRRMKKWDFTRFGHRLKWARTEGYTEKHGRKVTHDELAAVVKQTRNNMVNLEKRKPAPAWPPERFKLVAEKLDINYLFLQYGPPNEARGHMSKAMETIAEHLYAVDKSAQFDAADAQQIKQLIDAYAAGKKPRP